MALKKAIDVGIGQELSYWKIVQMRVNVGAHIRIVVEPFFSEKTREEGSQPLSQFRKVFIIQEADTKEKFHEGTGKAKPAKITGLKGDIVAQGYQMLKTQPEWENATDV